MATTIEKVKELVDANTVIGTPVEYGEILLIPISKISIGYASGGSEFPQKQADKNGGFGGGGGAGIKITPMAFVVIQGTSVKILPMASPADTTVDRVVEMVPNMFDKVTGFIDKKSAEKKEDGFEG